MDHRFKFIVFDFFFLVSLCFINKRNDQDITRKPPPLPSQLLSVLYSDAVIFMLIKKRRAMYVNQSVCGAWRETIWPCRRWTTRYWHTAVRWSISKGGSFKFPADICFDSYLQSSVISRSHCVRRRQPKSWLKPLLLLLLLLSSLGVYI